MATTGSVLYLSSADIDALTLTSQNVATAVDDAYRALAQGSAASVPKIGFSVTPSTFFHTMPARYDAKKTMGMKWIGTADNAGTGLPHISAMIVLSDIETAVITAIMDGTEITAIRPAAISLVAARRLARKDSRRIGFIACGVQAASHIDALCAEFPLKEVSCYSRRLQTAEAFAARMRERGFDAKAVADPRTAVEGQGIVVSSAPRASFAAPFLDPAWLSAGSFVTGVDLGRSWRCEGLRQMDIIATDHRTQSLLEAAQPGVLPWQGGFDADLSELASGSHSERITPEQRAFFIHPGVGLGDVAIAALALEQARAKKIGTVLPR